MFSREEDRLQRNVLAVERAEQSLIAARAKHAEAQSELHAVQQENAGDLNSGREPGPLYSHSLRTLSCPVFLRASTDSWGIILPTLSVGPADTTAKAEPSAATPHTPPPVPFSLKWSHISGDRGCALAASQ